MPARRTTTAALDVAEARWLRIDAQGLAAPRPARSPTRRAVLGVVERLGVMQLDAVNVLERTQFIVPFSRLGPYDVDHLRQLSQPGGGLLECWAHAASLVPVHLHPLLRWRMEASRTAGGRGERVAARVRAADEASAAYRAATLAEVAERGPLTGGGLSDPRPNKGEWWDRRSGGRRALERLFAVGELGAWRTATFERVYDLPERIVPPEILSAPTPPQDEAERRLLVMAVGALGVAALREAAPYYGIRPARAKQRLAELVENGDVVEVAVEGWDERAFVLPGARPRPPRRTTATLLAPFDSLFWDRVGTRRLFGFDYRLEIYVPQPQRRHGYYVLPLLLGDALVGRFDLKADRKASTLLVQASHVEPGADPMAVAPAAAVELDAMRRWLGLATTTVVDRGNLAPLLARAGTA